LLWKIEGNGLESPSYLYGTVHAVCPDKLAITDQMKEAIESSEQLVFELDFDEENIMAKMQAGMMMKDDLALTDLIEESDYQIVEKYFKDSLGMPLAALSRMNPTFLGTMTWIDVLNCTPTSYELEILKFADGREVLGLEELDEQLSYFDKISLQTQAEYLVASIVDLDRTYDEINKLNKAYADQDINQLFTSVYEGLKDIEQGEYYLLEVRNEKWIPRIDEMIRDKSSFIAVGAGHLGGEIGVIELLRKQGYSVNPVLNES
jgi:hypothetical protein